MTDPSPRHSKRPYYELEAQIERLQDQLARAGRDPAEYRRGYWAGYAAGKALRRPDAEGLRRRVRGEAR